MLLELIIYFLTSISIVFLLAKVLDVVIHFSDKIRYKRMQIMKDSIYGIPRNSKWESVREQHLKKYPYCAICDSNKFQQVHHIKPFHIFPDLELDETNLITLCEDPKTNHHLKYGHLGNWKNWNEKLLKNIKKYRRMEGKD